MVTHEEIIQKARELLEVLACIQASEWARRGALQHAEAFLRPLMQNSNASPQALDLLAKVLAQQGRWTEAREFWERALMRHPTNESFRRAIQRCQQIQQRSMHFAWNMMFLSVLLGAMLLGLVILGSYSVHSRRQVATLRQQTMVVHKEKETSFPNWQASVLKVLQSDSQLRSLNISVVQDKTTVRLRGEVPSLWLRYQVERTARRAIGNEVLLEISDLRLPKHYTVRQGDSLWKIAQRIYGNPMHWQSIAKVNHLSPPYRLVIGQQLQLPQ